MRVILATLFLLVSTHLLGEVNEISNSFYDGEIIDSDIYSGYSEVVEATKPKVATFPVVLHPYRKTQLYAEINAPIEDIKYRMGDVFSDEDVLISLKKEKYLANYEKAQSFLEKAEAELIATQELYEDYIASDFELNEAKAKLAEAKAELIVAKSDLEATTIVAPYAGRVVSLFVEEHELPPSNKQLIEIIDDATLVAKLLFDAENLKDIEIGKEIQIYLPTTDEKIKAKISRIGAMIDPSSDTIKIEAEVDNKDGALKAGMVGVAEVSLSVNNDR